MRAGPSQRLPRQSRLLRSRRRALGESSMGILPAGECRRREPDEGRRPSRDGRGPQARWGRRMGCSHFGRLGGRGGRSWEGDEAVEVGDLALDGADEGEGRLRRLTFWSRSFFRSSADPFSLCSARWIRTRPASRRSKPSLPLIPWSCGRRRSTAFSRLSRRTRASSSSLLSTST